MPDASQVQPVNFPLQGGLVLNKSTFAMQPGEALELQNFEPDIEGGYRRINGFSKLVTNIVPQTSASTDTTTIPDRFAAVIIDGATAFVYQYRGETQQYQLNFQRFEQGIKNMQTLLVNRFEYMRSTFIPKVGYTSTADLSVRVN